MQSQTNFVSEYVALLKDSVAQFREKIIVSILPVEIRTNIEAAKRYLIDNNACWMQDRLAPKHVVCEQFWFKGIHVGTLSAQWNLEPDSPNKFEMSFSIRNFDALDTLPFADRLDSVRLQHLKEFAEVKGKVPLSSMSPKSQHHCIIVNCNERKLAPHLDFCYLHEQEYQQALRNVPPTYAQIHSSLHSSERAKFAEKYMDLFSRMK